MQQLNELTNSNQDTFLLLFKYNFTMLAFNLSKQMYKKCVETINNSGYGPCTTKGIEEEEIMRGKLKIRRREIRERENKLIVDVLFVV